MRSDDLAPLLTPGPGPDLRFHAGRVESWDPETGANTISIAGALLSNVPILNTGESIALKAGHVVGLLAWKSSYWILGRITVPGDAQFAGAAVAFGGEGKSQIGNFDVTTAWADKVTGQITVPSWADEAIVLLTGTATVANQSAGADWVLCRALINGTPGGSNMAFVQTTIGGQRDIVHIGASAQRLIPNPGASITLSIQLMTVANTFPAYANMGAHLDAIALFRSVT